MSSRVSEGEGSSPESRNGDRSDIVTPVSTGVEVLLGHLRAQKTRYEDKLMTLDESLCCLREENHTLKQYIRELQGELEHERSITTHLRLENTSRWRLQERDDWRALVDALQSDRQRIEEDNEKVNICKIYSILYEAHAETTVQSQVRKELAALQETLGTLQSNEARNKLTEIQTPCNQEEVDGEKTPNVDDKDLISSDIEPERIAKAERTDEKSDGAINVGFDKSVLRLDIRAPVPERTIQEQQSKSKLLLSEGYERAEVTGGVAMSNTKNKDEESPENAEDTDKVRNSFEDSPDDDNATEQSSLLSEVYDSFLWLMGNNGRNSSSSAHVDPGADS